ncbi:MAG: tetratricopeptide repeat protein [Gammaproteobacteria bacterium]
MRTSIIFLILVSHNLVGCSLQNIQSDKPSPELSDIVQLEQTAKKAYLSEDWATAEKAYKNLTLQIPGDAEPWFRLGNIYARTNNLDAAVATYREALIRDPKNSKIWHNLGVIQLKQAANTFLEMQQYTEENDPLSLRARYAVNSIANLIDSGFQPDDKQ